MWRDSIIFERTRLRPWNPDAFRLVDHPGVIAQWLESFFSIALQPCERRRAATCGGSTRFLDRSPSNREQSGGELRGRWHRRFRQLDLAPFDLLFWPHPLVI